MPALAIACLFVFGGLLTYTISERRHRRRWWVIEDRVVEDEVGGPYRVDEVPTRQVLVRRRAPALIRHTALWSIYMGQMAVPGALLGLVGVLYAGIGLVSIPGLVLAIRIWRLGYALLRFDADAAAKARQVSDFAVLLNRVTVLVGGFALLFGGWGLTLVLWPYAALSFAHAAAMRRCAELLERERGEAKGRAKVDESVASEPVVEGSAWGVMRLGHPAQTQTM